MFSFTIYRIIPFLDAHRIRTYILITFLITLWLPVLWNHWFYWVLKQGKRDSNPRERFWRPQYCRCMIPLYIIIYSTPVILIRGILYFIHDFLYLQKFTQLNPFLWLWAFLGQALDLLVAVSCIHCCTSAPALSTSSSSRGLTPFGWEFPSWGGLHA